MEKIECIKKSTLTKVVEFLKPFKSWTDRIEADKEVTIHQVWPTLIQMKNHLEVAMDVDPEIEEDEDFKMIEGMKVLGRTYISSIRSDIELTDNHRIGVVLNPQMKKLRKMSTIERDSVYVLIDKYIRNSTTEEAQPKPAVGSQKQRRKMTDSLDEFMDESDEDTTEESVYSKEFTTYLNDHVKVETDFNLRDWWFVNRERYPSLFKLFLRVSSVPASSAPSERTFSTSGAIITDRRSALLPKSVENIMLVRNFYRS